MATKRTTKKQPADDPQLKEEVSDAVDQAEHDASTGNVSTSDAPPQPDLHVRDIRPE